MEKGRIFVFLIAVSILVFSLILVVRADSLQPTGPTTLTVDKTETLNTSVYPAWTVQAKAGNLTQLTIVSKVTTQTWQGYYGNISGTITLDDAYNFTMYDWAVAEPQGEIYASNGSSVTWTNIRCANYSANISYADGGEANFNLSTLEGMYGLNPDNVDGIDETFNVTGAVNGDGEQLPHNRFWVGTVYIGNGTCPATDTYQNDTISGDDYQEVLLTDNLSIVFTTIIENDINGSTNDLQGFNNRTWDFQMLVGENGHDGNTQITNYYFYVELE